MNEELEVLQDISSESLVVGYLYRLPDTIVEYEDILSADFDFSDEYLRLMYNLLLLTFKTNVRIDETSVNIQVSKMDEETQKKFKSFGGFNAIKRLMKVSESCENFNYIFGKLKTWNMIRDLDKKGFAVRNNIEKLKDKKPDDILKGYEFQLSSVASKNKGLEDSVNLGAGMLDFVRRLKEKPDVGIRIPHPIINTLTRGWRTGKVYTSGMGSGLGKSREMCYYAVEMGIIDQIPILIIVNEQDEIEWKLMLITCVINNIFYPITGVYIEEDEIALGQLTGRKDEIVQEAAKYIEENSKIQFQEMDAYSFDNLKIVLKKHKLRGINYVIYDTFKVFRLGEGAGGASWEQFVATSEMFKKLVGSPKKGGLDMGLFLTFQLTDESIANKILNSTAIAGGKQIKHNLDFIKMSRVLDAKDKEKIRVKIDIPGNPFNGAIEDLDPYKDYYLTFIDKNRGGKDHKYMIYEIQKGKIIFKELGWAVFGKKKEE
jgi:replicative DNA helicase